MRLCYVVMHKNVMKNWQIGRIGVFGLVNKWRFLRRSVVVKMTSEDRAIFQPFLYNFALIYSIATITIRSLKNRARCGGVIFHWKIFEWF